MTLQYVDTSTGRRLFQPHLSLSNSGGCRAEQSSRVVGKATLLLVKGRSAFPSYRDLEGRTAWQFPGTHGEGERFSMSKELVNGTVFVEIYWD